MNLELQERIDRYLLNIMSEEERKSFENEIEKNEELKETVELQRLIAKEIRRQSFQEILEETEREISKESLQKEDAEFEYEVMFSKSEDFFLNIKPQTLDILEAAEPDSKYKDTAPESKSKIKRISFYKKNKWVIPVAATIIGIVFIIWQPHKSSNQDLFNSSAFAYSSEAIRDAENVENTRGENFYFENLKQSDNMVISDAFSYYDNEEYNEAKRSFEEVLVPKQNYRESFKELTFYMALSQLFSNDAEKAVENLKFLSSISEFTLIEETNYYLALAYLKADQRGNARKVLKQIEKNKNGKYSKQASEILSNLRWL